MGKKVVIKRVMTEIMLADGRLAHENDKSLLPNLFALAGSNIKSPEDALRASKVKTKIALLNLTDKEEDDLIFEDEEFNYLNNVIDPKDGRYPDGLIVGAWIAPLIEMFRAAEDIPLKEEKKG